MTPPQPARKILGMFRKAEPAPAGWLPADRAYPSLAATIPGVTNQPGIYALWQLGVRPQWLRVGAAGNLASALAQMMDVMELGEQPASTVFVAWAYPPSGQHSGIVRFLADALQPALQGVALASDASGDLAAAAITYPLPPGTKI